MDYDEFENTIEGTTYADTLEKLEKHITEVFTNDEEAEGIVVVQGNAKIKTNVIRNKSEAEKLELIHYSAPCSQVITRSDFEMLKEKDKELGNGSCPECGGDEFTQGQGAKICEGCGTVV